MPRTAVRLAAAAALLTACADTNAPSPPANAMPSLSATTTITKTDIDETIVQFDPCANEVLEFRLRQQVVEKTTIDPNGTRHFHFVALDKGTTAIGTVTGRVWNQTGATVDNFNVSPAITGNETVVNNLNLIGRGSAPDLKIKELFHITVNPQGVVTVEFDRAETSCRQ